MKKLRLIAILFLTILASCEKDPLPEVETLSATVINTIQVTLKGIVVSQGISAVTTRGFCWASNPNPTILDIISNNGAGSGPFNTTFMVILETNSMKPRSMPTISFMGHYIIGMPPSLLVPRAGICLQNQSGLS